MTENEVISEAMQVVGAEVSNAAIDRNVPRQAISIQLASRVRELHRRLNTSAAKKRVTFDAEANQQSYALSGIADDISTIDLVVRSDAHVPRNDFRDCENDDPYVDILHAGPFFDVLDQQERYRVSQKYSYEVIIEDDEQKLFLYPTPKSAIKILVEYRSTGSSVSDLPEVAKQAMVYAACVAILDLQINRVNSMPTQTADHVPTNEDRIVVLGRQRDRYEQLYERELNELR